MSTNEKMMELYTLACGPLGPDTLLGDVTDLGPEDITADMIIDEIAFMDRFQNLGMSKFKEFLEPYRDSEPDTAPQEVGAIFTFLAAYLKRLKVLQGALLEVTESMALQYGDCTETLKAYEADVKEKNRRPVNAKEFAGLLDMTPFSRWAHVQTVQPAPSMAAGRVGFKETTKVLNEKNQEAEEALKVSKFGRKTQRNATGYQKFTFRDLGLNESDLNFEVQSGPTSASGRDSRTSSEGDSIAEECRRQEACNPFKPGSEERSDSLVAFSFEQEREEIQDESADPDWATQQRHAMRFSRIRNRVPTGHPSMIKKSSEELKQLVRDLQEAADSSDEDINPAILAKPDRDIFDSQTAQNTLINQKTSTAITPSPPTSP